MICVRSELFDVRWLGWQSNTVTLQRAGWQLAVNHDPCRFAYQLSAYHPDAGLVMTSRFLDAAHVNEHALRRNPFGHTGRLGERPCFDMDHVMRRGDVLRTYGHIEPTQWMAFDARPAITECTELSFEDATSFFRPIAVPEEKELIVGPQTVDEALRLILELQKGDQARLREKARQGAARTVHAQLVSLAA